VYGTTLRKRNALCRLGGVYCMSTRRGKLPRGHYAVRGKPHTVITACRLKKNCSELRRASANENNSAIYLKDTCLNIQDKWQTKFDTKIRR
jgi:hypothetical protein